MWMYLTEIGQTDGVSSRAMDVHIHLQKNIIIPHHECTLNNN